MFEIIPMPGIWILKEQVLKDDVDTDDYSQLVYLKPALEHMTGVFPSYYGMYLPSDSSRNYPNKKTLSLYKKRILIVDDEVDITFALKKGLTENGFEEVETFNSPQLALKHFKEGLYDLLILDIVMPQIGGFGLYDEMKKIDNKVKVCFITAFDVNYQALRAVFPTTNTADELGCFIRKPVEVQQLVKHVKGELDQTKD